MAVGCQTPTAFQKPDARWQTHTGQLQYLSGDTSVIGDVVVRTFGSSEFQLDFQSGPGFPLMQLRQSGDRARAEGILARGRWKGMSSRAPQQLRGWVKLREEFSRTVSPRRLTITPAEGERFTFVLAR